MGLSQSLYTGYSGLFTHQRGMDATSNNLANINTVGYKGTTFMFSDLMKQSIRGALPADGDRGSANPLNVGLGVTTGANVHNFTQGRVENSTDPLHCLINGNGFFVVNTAGGPALTRKGDFGLDNHESSGRRMLVMDGLPVQGWMANNGVVSPSQNTENIYLPQEGDALAGEVTNNVTLSGVLPTNTDPSGEDFRGSNTDTLELKGNLSADGQSHTTKVYATVRQTDANGNHIGDAVQEIPVRIDFHGPTTSADGTTNQWTWTMTTVDWPEAGDGVQIYPPAGDPAFTQGALNFHNTPSASQGFGAGQPVADTINPGASTVDYTSPSGVNTAFSIASNFQLNVSRLSNMENPPGGDGLETWFVNGNPTGTMLRTVSTWDECTAFEPDGTGARAGVRQVQLRRNAMIFEKADADNTGTTWTWKSSNGDAQGDLRFDTRGDLVSSSQSGGPLTFEWDGIIHTALNGRVDVTAQDGFADGVLQELSIDDNGAIWGSYSNRQSVRLAQLALGAVPNMNGLSGSSGTLFYANSASGAIAYGTPNDAHDGIPSLGLGTIMSHALESSNVDMGTQFTTLISIQRGMQFNSRIVTTSDEMLQTALQIKR